MIQLLIFLICFLKLTSPFIENSSVRILKYDPIEIADHKLSSLVKIADVEHLKRTAKEILIPRIVGTPEHDRVRDFIVTSMKELEWNVELDSFLDKTPTHGELKFENIITTLNPSAQRYLVLACHYDSKYMPNTKFVGATDSAIPCAMLINLAKVMSKHLKTQQKSKNIELSLMFIFFDGEEAFKEWGPNDSIYGAKHLAKKWKDANFLNKIDMLMLLDLIGAPDPKFYSFFQNTEKWFIKLLQIEEKLASQNLLQHYTISGVNRRMPNRYFQSQSANSYVEDDHTPFLKFGVPILHLITIPFPDFWHTADDDGDAIDYDTVENINRMLRVFVAEYLQIKMQ